MINLTFKKIILIVFCFAMLFSGCRKFNDREALGWDFPVKPGLIDPFAPANR
jgi:hypothetical protein